jgi:23S rRNA U2552 (ribose-2'-O)-methylase RlmE/FtsJ
MNSERSCRFDEVETLEWSLIKMSKVPKFTYTNQADSKKINDKKNSIGKIDSQTWLFARKLVNVYEYPKIKNEYCASRGVVKSPVSRAYYKLWEILQDFQVNCKGDSLHLAESPGGFIQAVVDYRNMKYLGESSRSYTVSLNSPEGNFEVPKFHRDIYKTKNVKIFEFEGENGGDITKIETFLNIQKELASKKIYLVTADGGINDHGNFNNKELNHVNLIFSELIQAVFILQPGGTFIVKIFDIFSDATVNIIYLLSYLFQSVIATKPLTSRSTNSEKYLVCTGFRKEKCDSIRNKLFKLLYCINYSDGVVVESLFQITSKKFLYKILKYNRDSLMSQQESIDKILNYIQRDKETFKSLKKSKDATIKNWLVKYRLIQV